MSDETPTTVHGLISHIAGFVQDVTKQLDEKAPGNERVIHALTHVSGCIEVMKLRFPNAALSENRTQESRWISTAERQPDKDGRLWAVLTESRRDGLVVGYIPMFEYYHFIDGWATDEPVRFWFEAELHPLPKVQK